MTYKVDILNPKAEKILKNLAELKLISLSEPNKDAFLQLVKRLRNRAITKPISIEAITEEVEIVRTKRYAHKNKAGLHSLHHHFLYEA